MYWISRLTVAKRAASAARSTAACSACRPPAARLEAWLGSGLGLRLGSGLGLRLGSGRTLTSTLGRLQRRGRRLLLPPAELRLARGEVGARLVEIAPLPRLLVEVREVRVRVRG